MGLGVIGEPLPLLYNKGSVNMGLVHFLLPSAILNIYVSLDEIDGTSLKPDFFRVPMLFRVALH